MVYQTTKDIDNYKKSLQSLTVFVEQFNLAVIKPDLMKSEGIILFWDDKYEESLDMFDKALLESKQSFVTLLSSKEVDDIRYHKALALIALGKYQKAIENLDIALTRSPLFAKAHHQKAVAFQHMNKKDEMRAEINKAHKVWRDADSNFIDYNALIEFENSIKP